MIGTSRDDWDLETDLMICKLQPKRMADLEKTMDRDQLKFEHLLLQWGLREVRAIEAKLPPLPKVSPKVDPQPVAKDVKHPFDSFWKLKVKPNDTTPVCKWKDPTHHTKQSFDPTRFNTGAETTC